MRHAEPQPLQAALERGHVVGDGTAARGRVLGIVAGHDLQQRGRVCDRAGHRTDGVHRPGERDSAMSADTAVGDLHADDTAESRRLPVRAAGVAAHGRQHHPRGQRGGVAAAASAGDPGRVPGISAVAVMRVPAGEAVGHFMHRRLADQHAAGGLEPGHGRGVLSRHEAREHFRAPRGRDPLGPEAVLDRHAEHPPAAGPSPGPR